MIFGHFPYEFALRNGYQKSFFYFTSIREPKDRYLSNYYRNKRDYEKHGKKFMSLETFLKLRYHQGQDNFYVRFFASKDINANPSTRINKKQLEDSIQNLKKLNFIFIINDMKKNLLSFQKNFTILVDMKFFFKIHKNKVSNSSYPKITTKENSLLNKLTFYDKQLYNKFKK